MTKTLVQFLLLLLLFFGLWFGLSRIDFIKAFKVEQLSQNTEEKLGEIIYESIRETQQEETDSEVVEPLNRIKNTICIKNHLDTAGIKLHLIKTSDVNAFALPDGHLVVYTGLITACDKPEELCGVLGHEIGHIEHHHVMKKLVKEIGLSALLTITAGRGGGEMGRQVVKLLSSTAYDRKMEKEADLQSVDYMLKAEIDPEPFANFMYKLADETDRAPKQFYWISTHPESEMRAKDILAYLKNRKATKKPVMEPQDWEAFKEAVSKL